MADAGVMDRYLDACDDARLSGGNFLRKRVTAWRISFKNSLASARSGAHCARRRRSKEWDSSVGTSTSFCVAGGAFAS